MITKVDLTSNGTYSNGQMISVVAQFELKDVGTDVKVAVPA